MIVENGMVACFQNKKTCAVLLWLIMKKKEKKEIQFI